MLRSSCSMPSPSSVVVRDTRTPSLSEHVKRVVLRRTDVFACVAIAVLLDRSHEPSGSQGTRIVWARISCGPHGCWHANDNDNDNDTLREVPHPSNEGLALQARVSGP